MWAQSDHQTREEVDVSCETDDDRRMVELLSQGHNILSCSRIMEIPQTTLRRVRERIENNFVARGGNIDTTKPRAVNRIHYSKVAERLEKPTR